MIIKFDSINIILKCFKLLCLFSANLSLSQEIRIDIENSDKLYAGYPCQVKIQVDNTKQRTFNFNCEGCEKFNLWNPIENSYAVIAKDTSFIVISYQDSITKQIHSKQVQVAIFDSPIVLVDGLSNKNTIRKEPKTIGLDIDSGNSNYRPIIVKIGYEINGKSFFSFGDELNKEVLKQMNTYRKGVLKMTVYYYNVKFEMVTVISEFNYDLE